MALLIVVTHNGTDLVVQACEHARHAGVRAGMTLAHARSLLIGITALVEPHQPESDTEALRALARWAIRWAPLSAPDPPDGLLLDITGCAHLYRGEGPLAAAVAASLSRLGFAGRVGVAPTSVCARAAARYGATPIMLVGDEHREPAMQGDDTLARDRAATDGSIQAFLAPLPIAALGLDGATDDILEALGMECIGQLFDLPRAELASRFGDGILRRLDQAIGAVPDPIDPIRPVEPLEEVTIFDGPVVSPEAIEVTVRDLLHRLLQKLNRIRRSVGELHWELKHTGSARSIQTLRLSHPSREAGHLWSLLRPRLERLHLGHGVEEVRLRAAHAPPTPSGQLELWPDARSACGAEGEAAWGRLLDHLRDRMGSESVNVVSPLETYVPEQAFVFRPWEGAVGRPSRKTKEVPRVHAAARPTRLLSRPEPARVVTLSPDGPLIRLQWRGGGGAVRCCLGPERLALPWWTESPETADMLRDYYTVQDEQGCWLWVFRDTASGAWFVHGEWA